MDHQADTNRTDLMTITRFVLNEQSKYPESRGDFTILLNHIVLGCKFVCSAVNKAGLAKLIGLAGETNVQGEEQKKLDVLSNEVFVKALISSGRTCLLVSEEVEEAIFAPSSHRGKYIVVFDPLDGSSNIDCGVSIGTIFGIYMVKNEAKVSLEDALQPGNQMLAAGYCMYGSSCTFVLSTGNGVNGFTLDPSLGEFILTHPNIKIPRKGKIYSVNEGNAKNWDEPTTRYVQKCKFPQDGSSPKSLRYIGSMVADIHRTLLYGGIFMYPADIKSPNGKLRILYEVFPMSYLMEQAGGQAFTGKQRALDLVPKKLHERSPIFLGSYDDIEQMKELAHVSCLRIATPVDQLPRIDAQLQQSQRVVEKYSALAHNGVGDEKELDQFMTHYVLLLCAFKEQLQQHVRVHAMEAVMACWDLEQSLQSLTGVSPGEGTGATMSDDEDDQAESNANLYEGSLDGGDTLGFGPLVPTETERSLMERVRHELKHELKQDYKEKIVDIREEILRKRRAGKLPGDTTSLLKAWWQAHSKWPYPTEEDKARLVQETGLQLKQINNWFINQRKRNWHTNNPSSSSNTKSKRKSAGETSNQSFM